MDYGLIALDIDGTTMMTGQPPSPRVLAALAAAQAQGVRVILATGRGYDSARRYAHMLGIHDPLICFQGALVREQSNGMLPLLTDAMPLDAMLEVLAVADELDVETTFYTENDYYVSRMRHDRHFYDLWFGMPLHIVPDLSTAARGVAGGGVPLIKGLFVGTAAELGPLEGRLRAELAGRIGVARSHELFFEFMAPQVSKGRAVGFLAERFGVPRAATIAVGDSDNDISMIQWAGLGVAMGNAAPHVRAAANWIAPPVQEDGVAEVIERFVLRGERLTSTQRRQGAKDTKEE